MAKRTIELIQERETALNDLDLEEVKRISTEMKKFKRIERRAYIHEKIDKDLDPRVRNAGI